jgi:asparaginyl-tRNA synthetase
MDMKRVKIMDLLNTDEPIENVLLKGWVRTKRDSKTFSFIEVNDGSCLRNMQVIVDASTPDYDQIKKLTTGSAICVVGNIVESRGGGQQWEVQATSIDIISIAPETFPLQKKRHTDEYLRSIAHLRPRTNKYGAMFRLRSELSMSIHQFFHERGFRYVHTPVITGSDCEGAGELFRVTTLDINHCRESEKPIDYTDDFFGCESNLTVSGQLSAEMLALSLGDVYTFGPTFRAENSNTSRHVAEFWMIEPEMAFCDLNGNMELGESLIKESIQMTMESCRQDIDLFARFVDKSLMATLDNVINSEFVRLPYKDAVNILINASQSFQFEVSYGVDFQSEHERYLTEKHFKKPIILFDYPKNIKPFYMRLNDDDETVAAMDILVPRIGELIGGSQREERLDILEKRMDESGLPKDPYWWYLDSRRYGTVPHSGFGMRFERLLMLLTGVTNIRDVIPFPRTPGTIDF